MQQVERERPPEGWEPAPQTRWEQIPGTAKVAGGAVLLLVLILIGASLFGGKDGPKPPPNNPPSSAQPSTGEAMGEPKKGPAGVMISPIKIGAGGADSIHGVPIKYPHTKDGGTAAALNYYVAITSPLATSDTTGPRLVDYVAPRFGWAAWQKEVAELDRQKWHLNRKAEVTDESGRVDRSKRYVSTRLLRYGAFRVVSAAPDAVEVEIWAPGLWGVVQKDAGVDQPGVELHTGMPTGTVRVYWADGDWRFDVERSQKEGPVVEVPGSAPLVSPFAWRAEHFPPKNGWQVVADASEKPDALEAAVRGEGL